MAIACSNNTVMQHTEEPAEPRRRRDIMTQYPSLLSLAAK
ncbi:hypothetical protein KGM_200200 [Danaus plexippus plexippus]|uniref:Uncharacterized protein n=1 Tax=Danaus plexippus plexippus TaxID=278856 RepID=A0A212F1U7_DANPL|nr:hypothetical protein KGM_200200 [Danaus plexippus plexippus]